MSSHPTLPFEIIEVIVDTLAQHDPGFSSLKMCSVVCQVFLDLCRKHIFASVTTHGQHHGVLRLLSATPAIADHIRKLKWWVKLQVFRDSSLPRILEKITKLESLTIYWQPEARWTENHLRSPIIHLLHLPTLIRLEICDIQDFSFADLIPCTNLREFRLRSSKPATGLEYNTPSSLPHNSLQPTTELKYTSPSIFPHNSLQLRHLSFGGSSSTAISMIGVALRPDGRPIFNLAILPSVTLLLYAYDDFEASRKLFQHCSQLSKVDISLSFPPLSWTGIAKMLKPSIETLTHLHFTTGTQDETGTNDPLGGLVAELEEMRHQNVVEKMTIDVSVSSCYQCSHGDDWGLLDVVLTQSGWPKLERVSLNIFLWLCYREDDLAVALESLPQTQFPRLSSSRSVVFQFAVIDKSYG
ncbi:hypothetical protein M413DRAFT_32235 [Hebeloma cylindrosporum]|uniref:F-box domain-containing protein n=1 Tax=Hebeloma cylindrosporum TaxID=76867 RepID=A0A0C3BWK2_HEBCY|nr:hypothetical protein M413DRAFT_32235 [Hebeloma cylindrosporum h7]